MTNPHNECKACRKRQSTWKGGRGQVLNSVGVRHFRIEINRCRFRIMCVQIVSPARVGKSLQYATSSDFNAFRSTTQHHWLLSSTVQLTAHYFDSDIEVRQSPFDPSRPHPRDLFPLPQARLKPYQNLAPKRCWNFNVMSGKSTIRESPSSCVLYIRVQLATSTCNNAARSEIGWCILAVSETKVKLRSRWVPTANSGLPKVVSLFLFPFFELHFHSRSFTHSWTT